MDAEKACEPKETVALNPYVVTMLSESVALGCKRANAAERERLYGRYDLPNPTCYADIMRAVDQVSELKAERCIGRSEQYIRAHTCRSRERISSDWCADEWQRLHRDAGIRQIVLRQ